MTQRSWSETTEKQLQKEIGGILRSVIDVHGPITPSLIGSASKRLTAHMRAKGYWVDGGNDTEATRTIAEVAVNDTQAGLGLTLGRWLGQAEEVTIALAGRREAKIPTTSASTDG